MVHRFATPRKRRLPETAAFLLIGLAFIHTWFIDGFPISCRVDGGSMATTLLGSHVDLVCPECRFAFACDAGEAHDRGEDSPVICPNCTHPFTPERPVEVLSGDRVLIDRSAFQFRRPRRWEVVAFERAEEGQGLVVKRVVGLPGENIRIDDGRVYIDDTLLRKDLREQHAMRILVHDDDHCGPNPRWRPQDFGSNWTRHEGRAVHSESPNDEIGWLVYSNVDVLGGGKASPVTDYGFYSRGRMQLRDESIHPTPDVAMSLRFQDVHGRGVIWLRASDGRDEFMVQIDPAERKFKVLRNRKPLADGAGSLPGPLRGETLEVSLIDRQFLLAVGSKTLYTAAIDTPGQPPLTAEPLAIGVQGLGVAVDHLRVYRAIYYTDPPAAAGKPPATYTVGPDEYFVLGDNSPISDDSRTWTEDRMVSHKSLAGKPFVVIFPACGFSLGRWHIQVPDLARIRYIR